MTVELESTLSKHRGNVELNAESKSVGLLQSLPTDAYNVTLISPQTYFAFTPLLPSACVGTVEVRSLVEPLRKLVARVRGHYLMGTAVDLDMSERLLEVEVPSDQGEGTMRAYVPCTCPAHGCIQRPGMVQ
jgi:NADH dehydrogenase